MLSVQNIPVFFLLLTCWTDIFRRVRKIAKEKAIISFVVSLDQAVRLTAWNNSAPNGRIFMKHDNLSIFKNSVEKIQV
jgi:hypothetical protein